MAMSCVALIRTLVLLSAFAGSAAKDFLAKRTRIMEMSETTATTIFEDNSLWRRPILVFFRPNSGPRLQEETEVRAALEEVHKSFFVVFSGDRTETEVKLMNTMSIFTGEELPLLGILSFDFHVDNPKAEFHSFRYRGNITRKAVIDFTQDYSAGKLRPEGRLSEPLPDGEGEHDGFVRHLVGQNFDKVTQDPEKDTLVYWYGDGCGWCVKYKGEFKQLAAKLRHVKSLEIAWIDASRNGVAQPKRFPTVALFPAKGKAVPKEKEVPFLNDVRLPAVEYMGDILKGEPSIKAITAWLHKEAAIPFEDTPPVLVEEDNEIISMIDLGPNRDL